MNKEKLFKQIINIKINSTRDPFFAQKLIVSENIYS